MLLPSTGRENQMCERLVSTLTGGLRSNVGLVVGQEVGVIVGGAGETSSDDNGAGVDVCVEVRGTAVSVIVAVGVVVGVFVDVFVGIVVGMDVMVAGAGSSVAIAVGVGVVLAIMETAVAVSVGGTATTRGNCFDQMVRPVNKRIPKMAAPINTLKALLPGIVAICLLSFIREV